MVSQYSKLAKIEPIADVGFDFFAKAAQYKSEKIQQTYGALQSTLAGFVNGVDIVKEDDRQYFNDKVKNVVTNLNQFKDLDLTDPNTTYQLQSMLGEVKQDGRILGSIVDSANFRNVQKQRDLIKTNPKFIDLYDADLEKYDQKEMQKWINTPGGRFSLQTASINPRTDKQLEAAANAIKERKVIQEVDGNIVQKTIKDQNLLYNSGAEIVSKNVDYYKKKYMVNYDFDENPREALSNINSMISAKENEHKNNLIELETAKLASKNPNEYNDEIAKVKTILNNLANKKALVKEGKDINSIRGIGFDLYVDNVALQQANKGYSYISDVKMTDQAELEARFQKEGYLLDKKYAYEDKAAARDYEYQKSLKEMDIYGKIAVKGTGSSGKTSTGIEPVTIAGVTKGQDTNYYQQLNNELPQLKQKALGLQKDLIKLVMESSTSNPKVKAILEKYPDLQTKLHGENSLKSILSLSKMVTDLSGEKIENGASMNEAITLMNQIKEVGILHDFKSKELQRFKTNFGNDEETFNREFKKAGLGSTVFKNEIALDFLNKVDKDNKSIFNQLIPYIRSGAILDENGDPFDSSLLGNNKGENILSKIDWEKTEKRNYNVENSTLEIVPKDEDGKNLYDKPVKIKLDVQFLKQLKGLYGEEYISNLNKVNSSVDYYIQQPNNSQYIETLKQRSFYIDRNKAPNVPKGTVLEYKVANVREPLPSAGRNNYSYDVNVLIGNKPYPISVESVDQVHEFINMRAEVARELALKEFVRIGKQPTVSELETATHKNLIELIKKSK